MKAAIAFSFCPLKKSGALLPYIDLPLYRMSYQPNTSAVERSNSHPTGLPSPRLGKATILSLPPELLAQAIAHLETVRPLFRFSQTCKRFYIFVQQHGFQSFVKTRFPHIQPPALHPQSFWRDAALGLTTLERNWDRKAFIAWNINSYVDDAQDPRRDRTYYRSGQTMGFVPVLDSYEAWYGGDWSSRKEVVAWGAGAQLEMRVKIMGRKAKDWFETTGDENPRDFNAHHQRIKWATYREVMALEGKDDITSVIVMPQQSLEDPEQLVIGRASGGLHRISLSVDSSHDQARSLASYETAGRPIRSTTQNPNRQHLFAACLSDASIALYPLDSPSAHVSPLGEVSARSAGGSEKIWSSRFLGHDRLAVCYGFSKEPIHVYDTGCGQFTDQSVRSLAITDTQIETRLDVPDIVLSGPTAIFSLAPIPDPSAAGEIRGDVFLSGGYDGLTR